MEYLFEKHFTLSEAQDLVPWLRAVFGEVHRLLVPGNLAGTAPAPGEGRRNGNGHKPSGGIRWPAGSLDERVAAANELLGRITAKGIVIQDWQRGLVDFPHLRNGREVFLCYELGDGDRIGHFHGIDEGFAGRQSL